MMAGDTIQPIDSAVDIARTLAAQGEMEAARQTLEQASENYPESYQIWTHLGLFYYQTGRYNRALQALQRRMELFPADLHLCLILADVYAERKEYDKASECLREALRLEGKQDNLQQRMAELEKKQRLTPRNKTQTAQWLKRGLMLLNEVLVGFIERIRGIIPIKTDDSTRRSTCNNSSSSFRLKSYLEFMRRYDRTYQSDGMAYHKTREVLLASAFLPIHDPQALVLDLGTGKNSLPLYWSTLGCRTVAMDGSLYGFSNLIHIEEQLKAMLTSLVSGDMRFLPFKENTFDAVSSLCAIEHIPEEGDIETLREIYRVMKPGGRAVITVESCRIHRDTWLEVPYEIGYQTGGGAEHSGWEEVFCRNYSPETLRSRLLHSAPWRLVEEGFYDDTRLPLRQWLDPNNHSPGSVFLRRFQPLLSLLFYRKKASGNLSPSSIGYLVVEKAIDTSCKKL